MPEFLTALSQQPCRLSTPALVCSLGDNLVDISRRLFTGERGLSLTDSFTPGRTLPLGQVHRRLPDMQDWPPQHRSRNNQLLEAALQQLAPAIAALRERQPQARIGVVLGTSTSGIGESEQAVAHFQREAEWPTSFVYQRQEIGSPSAFVAEHLGLDGPAYTLSTACSSSARALASGRRLLAMGVCDAVIAGGADSLCALTVNGFAALGAVSDEPCLPFSANRSGINIGEAAALFLLTPETGGIQLAGYGESSDAHHISAPLADGSGALAAMNAALDMAGITAAQVDYVNLHGTATAQNDSMEAQAIHQLFADRVPCSSTKALTGHTLGACGALEAAFCWLSLREGCLPPQVNDGIKDPALAPIQLAPAQAAPMRYALSNSFAFGGNNAALLLERTDV